MKLTSGKRNRYGRAMAASLTVLFGFAWMGRTAPIDVKDAKGRTMTVEVLSYAPATNKTRIRRKSDKQVFEVDLGVFDADSQKKIVEAAPEAKPELEILVSTGKRRKRQADSSYMKNQEVTATVKVRNDSRLVGLEDGKFTIILMGRSTERYKNRDRDGGKILSKQEFAGSIPPTGEFEHECESIVTSYDSDRDDSNIGGWEFEGYLLVVQEADGEVLATSSNLANVKSVTLKDPELLKKAMAQSEGALVQLSLQPQNSKVKQF